MKDNKYKLGCVLSPEDSRDWGIDTVAKSINAAELPTSYLTEGKVDVLNQGVYSTCVAHAIAAAMGYGEFKLGYDTYTNFSRGFIYANRRATDYQGEGMRIREALKQLNHDGDCVYADFTYNNTYPYCRKKLLEKEGELKVKAKPHTVLNYFRCYGELEVKAAIMLQGAVIISIPVYEYGLAAEVKLPTDSDQIDGYHAMCCVGWDETGWIIQNSWGKSFGTKGYCHIKYEYPIKEFWGITVKEGLPPIKKDKWYKRLGNWFVGIWTRFTFWWRSIFNKK